MTFLAPRDLAVTPAAAARAAALEAVVPVLRTARCVLRAPRLGDYDLLERLTDGPTGAHLGGPRGRDEGWLDFCAMTAVWLLRGHGFWAVEVGGEAAGLVGVGCEPGDREHELGWMLLPAHEGRGLAFEAAVAARDHAWGTLALPSLVSYVAAGNARSEALARRLGALPDGVISEPDGDVTVFRHPRPGAAS